MARFEKGKPGGGRLFQPGQSGNPGGKPKAIIEVTAAARALTMEAIETLKRVMLNEKATASARVSAAVAIIERGWGKAPATITLLRGDAELKELSDAELIAIASGTDGETAQPNGSGHPSESPGDKGKPN
jgi:hypothetical protein